MLRVGLAGHGRGAVPGVGLAGHHHGVHLGVLALAANQQGSFVQAEGQRLGLRLVRNGDAGHDLVAG